MADWRLKSVSTGTTPYSVLRSTKGKAWMVQVCQVDRLKQWRWLGLPMTTNLRFTGFSTLMAELCSARFNASFILPSCRSERPSRLSYPLAGRISSSDRDAAVKGPRSSSYSRSSSRLSELGPRTWVGNLEDTLPRSSVQKDICKRRVVCRSPGL
jgi:hypothetical protein